MVPPGHHLKRKPKAGCRHAGNWDQKETRIHEIKVTEDSYTHRARAPFGWREGRRRGRLLSKRETTKSGRFSAHGKPRWPNGQVLLAGGRAATRSLRTSPVRKFTIRPPERGISWVPCPYRRVAHQAVLLPNGKSARVRGLEQWTPISSARSYMIRPPKAWTLTGAMGGVPLQSPRRCVAQRKGAGCGRNSTKRLRHFLSVGNLRSDARRLVPRRRDPRGWRSRAHCWRMGRC